MIFENAQIQSLWLFRPTNYPLAATASVALIDQSLMLVSDANENKKSLSTKLGDVSPEILTGIFSHSTYWWINRLFWSGFRGNLSLDDLYPLNEELSSNSTASRHNYRRKKIKGEFF